MGDSIVFKDQPLVFNVSSHTKDIGHVGFRELLTRSVFGDVYILFKHGD